MGSFDHHPDIEIPIIDISGYINHDDEQTKHIAKQLHSACQSPGFFQIVGHTVSSELRSELLAKLVEFFAISLENKQELHRGQSRCLRGYEAVGEQKLEATYADQKEGFMIGPEFPNNARFLQGPNQWPSESAISGFRKIFTAYFDEVHNLSKTMFRLMALSLELDEDYFDAFVGSKDSISMCRAHRYPPATAEMASKSRGIGAHTDFGALTLLLQDDVLKLLRLLWQSFSFDGDLGTTTLGAAMSKEFWRPVENAESAISLLLFDDYKQTDDSPTVGGLEVYHKATQTWHPVKCVKDAFVVNIGDMMERWTNGMYTSTRHRVISPVSTNYRYSIAYFNEGLLDQMIECIPSCLKAGDKPLYTPVRAEDHLRARYGNTY